MAEKTCFLICPIGEDGSDIRKSSDDFMDLIIVPALEKFDFEVLRADKIPRPSVITTDIIQLVQNAELCIIDLTGSNANVFYECGRRHETGKPFIQLIKKGEKLPFDVAGIRTIQYDLSTVRSAHETIKEIQNYVSELSTSDFSPRTAGESLSSLASAIRRIERKLESVTMGESSLVHDAEQTEYLERIRIEANPPRAFNEALDAGELNKARLILPILHAKLGNVGDVLVAAALFANSGDPAAAELCVKILESPLEPLDAEELHTGIMALGNYYDLTDGEREGAKVLDPIIQAQVKRDDIQDSEKAYLLNQLQKVLYVSEQYEYALTIEGQVVDLNPSVRAYWNNLALIYEKLGMNAKAAKAIDSCLEIIGIKDFSFDDLSRTARLYVKAERADDAKKILGRMYDIDRQRTEKFISENDDLKPLRTT